MGLINRSSTIYDGILTTPFSHSDEHLAAQLKAMAHPARLRILELLAQRGECVCGETVDVLPLAQSTVSQHLKILKAAGFLIGTIDGPRSCYCIDGQALIPNLDDRELVLARHLVAVAEADSGFGHVA